MKISIGFPKKKLHLPAALIPILAIALAISLGAVLIAIAGISPLVAYKSMLIGAFGSVDGIAETLVKTTPLLLVGLGMAVSYRAGLVNIGGEGQLVFGALGIGIVGLFFGDNNIFIGIPLAILVGFIFGAFWGAIAGVLKAYFKTNEIIVTLMLNYIAYEFRTYLISGPWQDPATTEPFTARIASGVSLPIILPGTRLHAGILLAIILGAALWLIINRTVLGFQLTITGANQEAARYSGVKVPRMIVIAMMLSGGLAGLAGGSEVGGVHHRIIMGLSPGYGYTGISIALLGKGNPIGIFIAALLFGALEVGASKMQRATGVPVPVALIIEGTILLFVLSAEMIRNKRLNNRKRE